MKRNPEEIELMVKMLIWANLGVIALLFIGRLL